MAVPYSTPHTLVHPDYCYSQNTGLFLTPPLHSVIVHHFHIALFSALQQTHCALVAGDS